MSPVVTMDSTFRDWFTVQKFTHKITGWMYLALEAAFHAGSMHRQPEIDHLREALRLSREMLVKLGYTGPTTKHAERTLEIDWPTYFKNKARS